MEAHLNPKTMVGPKKRLFRQKNRFLRLEGPNFATYLLRETGL